MVRFTRRRARGLAEQSLVVAVDFVAHLIAQPLAEKLVDGDKEQLGIAGELLAGIRATTCVDDCGHVIGAKVFFDELACRSPRLHGPQRCNVQVIEHDRVDPAG